MRWIPTPPVTRTQSHIKFQPSPFWNCVWRWIDARVEGFTRGGGNRRDWDWLGCGRWIRRWNDRIGRGGSRGQR